MKRTLAGALLALVVAACGAAATPLPTAAPTSAVPLSTPMPTTGPTSEPTLVPTARPVMPGIEYRLLAVLPAMLGASPVEEDVEREMAYVASSSRGPQIAGFAAAFVGDAGENIATVALARIKTADPAGLFARWRADFDEAACAANGGPGGRTTRQLGGRSVTVTACLGGASVYHVLLRDQTLIVSILSLGAGDFGARLIEGLRE